MAALAIWVLSSSCRRDSRKSHLWSARLRAALNPVLVMDRRSPLTEFSTEIRHGPPETRGNGILYSRSQSISPLTWPKMRYHSIRRINGNFGPNLARAEPISDPLTWHGERRKSSAVTTTSLPKQTPEKYLIIGDRLDGSARPSQIKYTIS